MTTLSPRLENFFNVLVPTLLLMLMCLNASMDIKVAVRSGERKGFHLFSHRAGGVRIGVVLASPQDPHVAHCGSMLPHTAISTCSWFEGWYVRVVDHSRGDSFAAIVGTINGTGESMITILACYNPINKSVTLPNTVSSSNSPVHDAVDNPRSIDCSETNKFHIRPLECKEDSIVVGRSGNQCTSSGSGSTDPAVASLHEEVDGCGDDFEKIARNCHPSGECGRLRLAQAIVRGAKVTLKNGESPSCDPDDKMAPGFEWRVDKGGGGEAFGFLRVKGFAATELDLHVGGVRLQVITTDQVAWRSGNPGAGPEGWVARASKWLPPSLNLPCRWFVHSLGSSASYTFTNASVSSDGTEDEEHIIGRGWAHEEKNWGGNFPDGHVWAQAVSKDRSVKIVLAVAFFDVGPLSSPPLVAIGFRSATTDADFRSIDPGTFITSQRFDACAGLAEIAIASPAGKLSISFRAPPRSFSPPLLAPTRIANWSKMCVESFSAFARIRFVGWTPRRHGILGWALSLLERRVSTGEEHEVSLGALEFSGNMRCKDGDLGYERP